MQVKYPINTTANPSSEAALQELISKIRTESTGHYLISEGGRWHGGIHITEKSHPNHAFEPIQALADGELVAYRITEDYLQSTYQDQTLRYSNSFCLLRHQCPIPESENTFTFYSLYMHLRPLNAQPGCLYRVNNNRSIRRTANPTHTDANRKTLPAGSLIECLPDVPAEQHQLRESEGAIEYLFVKARTYNLDSGAGSESFWIALHEKNRPSFHTDGFEAQNTQPRWYPQPRITPPTDHGTREDLIPLPKIEQQPEIQLNQLVILDTPMPLGAGDALGYLGLHERLCRAGDGSTEHSYQIHLETFAIEPPPQVLFNTEHWRWMKKGEITDHEGNPQENNTFFKDLVTSLDDNNDDHLSYREVQSAYHNKGTAKSLEHLISHHASEWQDDANRKQYKSWELYLGQVRAWIKGKKERKAFYERLQENLKHEKERLTQLKWFDAAQDRLGLNKEVWHMHPIRLVHQVQQHAGEDVLTILRSRLIQREGWVPHMYRDSVGYVTVGVGHLIARVERALDVAFKTSSGERATREQIIAEYNRLRSVPVTSDGTPPPEVPNKDFFENYTANWYRARGHVSLRIDDDEIERLLQQHITSFTEDLRDGYQRPHALADRNSVDFDRLPAKVKLAVYDLIFNVGQVGFFGNAIIEDGLRDNAGFHRFNRHISNGDWEAAAGESRRPQVGDDRNQYVRELLLSAARGE